MRIRLLTSLMAGSGTHNGGDVLEWDDADAARLIEAGHAEPFTPPPVETATVDAPETAAAPKPKKR